jgi:hypothetical protein
MHPDYIAAVICFSTLILFGVAMMGWRGRSIHIPR